MNATTIHVDIELEPVECYKCGCIFGLTSGMRRQRLSNKEDFYCPNGHCQAYLGKSHQARAEEAEALARRLQFDRDRLANDNMDLAKKNKNLRARARSGTCAFCKRSFANVKRHMDTQHAKGQ